MRSSTGMPCASGSTPTVSRPSPSTRGRRPVATSSRSPRSSSRPSNSSTYSSPSRRTPLACSPKQRLDPVGGERLAERLAQRLRLARQHVVHALDERHRGAHARTAWAISTPTGPPPSTSSRRGTSFSPVASRFVQTRRARAGPGTGGMTASEPGRDHHVVRRVAAAHLHAPGRRRAAPRRAAPRCPSPRGSPPCPRPRSPRP